MPVTVTNSRPSTAPTSSGTLFGGGTGSARHRGRRTPPRVGDGSERRFKLRQRLQAACSLQAAKPEMLRTRGLATVSENLVRQQPLQACKIVPEALPNLILEPVSRRTVLSRAAGFPARHLRGVRAKLGLLVRQASPVRRASLPAGRERLRKVWEAPALRGALFKNVGAGGRKQGIRPRRVSTS